MGWPAGIRCAEAKLQSIAIEARWLAALVEWNGLSINEPDGWELLTVNCQPAPLEILAVERADGAAESAAQLARGRPQPERPEASQVQRLQVQRVPEQLEQLPRLGPAHLGQLGQAPGQLDPAVARQIVVVARLLVGFGEILARRGRFFIDQRGLAQVRAARRLGVARNRVAVRIAGCFGHQSPVRIEQIIQILAQIVLFIYELFVFVGKDALVQVGNPLVNWL